MLYPLASKSPSSTTNTIENSPLPNQLSPAELEVLSARLAASADQWLADKTPVAKAKKPRQPKSERGQKPKTIDNPFYGFIGYFTYWGRYPAFAMDIIEGIARLDWHDRAIGDVGKSMPLSVRSLVVILESLPVVTNEAVEDFLQLGERHARRYVKAVELIVPRMMTCRPPLLINEMEGIGPEPKACEWDDCNELSVPSAEELAKLHHDLRTLTQFNTREANEAEWSTYSPASTVITFPARQAHSKKVDVMRMLAQGVAVKAIERSTGVSAKTIRKWRGEMRTMATDLQAA